MSDNPQTMTIDGRVPTYMSNAFVDEAEGLIAALVEKGIPGKLRPGRSSQSVALARYPCRLGRASAGVSSATCAARRAR
jgi:hypothetical protein